MQKNKLRFSLYFLSFFASLHVAIPAYINSSFISQSISSEKIISYLYTIGALLTIAGLIWLPSLLKKIGNFITTLLIALLSLISLLFLAFSHNLTLIFISFVTYLILTSLIYFNLDIFLEQQSTDDKTGNIRGIHLTIINTAWILSPLIGGLILANSDQYWKIYLLSAIVLIPFLFVLNRCFKTFRDPAYNKTSFLKILKTIKQSKDIYRIFMVKFLLNFFYAWMVIYMPIYLLKNIGFEWNIIGLIFTIMLLPFVLLELPLGKLADKFWGEKEILNYGIIILSLSTMAISFLTTQTFWLWSFLLFMTRVGASAIEISSESYFFKHINAQNTNLISLFRITTPLAYSIAPLIAILILSFLDFRFLFLTLGLIMFLGLKYSLNLKDTK